MLLEPGKHTIFAKCACCEGPPRNTVVSATLIQAQSRGKSARPRPQDTLLQPMFGEWLSLVEHLVRDQGVGGSNPLSPTIFSITYRLANPTLWYWLRCPSPGRRVNIGFLAEPWMQHYLQDHLQPEEISLLYTQTVKLNPHPSI